MTGCRWPQSYLSIGVCIARNQKFRWPLRKAREHVAVRVPAAEVKPEAPAHRGPEVCSQLEQCPVWLSFIISRTISGLWKYVLSCLGCYLTSSIYLMVITCRHHDENCCSVFCFHLKGKSGWCLSKVSQHCPISHQDLWIFLSFK